MTSVETIIAPVPAAVPKFYYFINGIKANVEDLVGGWQYRAERYILFRTPHRANTYHYRTHAVTRWLEQSRHVKQAAELLTLQSKPGEQKILVGHSNGCEIICQMFKEYPTLQAEEVHLIAGAVEDSFEKNGLNKALRNGNINQLYVYVSNTDTALKWARYTHWVNWLNPRWGYGDLGRVGPSEVAEDVAKCVRVWPFHGYDHGDYFLNAPHPEMPSVTFFDYTMRMIVDPG